MKKIWFLSILMPLLVVLLLGGRAETAADIEVFCWALTPQTKAVLSGLAGVLARTLPVVAAEGDYARGKLVVKQLAAQKPRLLIVLGTQALSLTAPQIKKIPVVFAMVADPYQTGAAYNSAHPDDHQENITGIASPPPLTEAIRHTLKLFPAKRSWGLLYDPGEGPSVELQQNFAALAQAAGLKFTALAAHTGTEARAALEELAPKGVQVLFIPPDQLSRQYVEYLAVLGAKRRFVVVNGNPRIANRGAIISVTLDYEAIGAQAGRLVQQVLAGAKPAGIPITQVSPVHLQVDESLLTAWAGYPPGKK